MTQICEAVYENGSFRLLAPVEPQLVEGQHVRLALEEVTPKDILEMAMRVYDGLTEEQVEAIEMIAFDRSNFFRNKAE